MGPKKQQLEVLRNLGRHVYMVGILKVEQKYYVCAHACAPGCTQECVQGPMLVTPRKIRKCRKKEKNLGYIFCNGLYFKRKNMMILVWVFFFFYS